VVSGRDACQASRAGRGPSPPQPHVRACRERRSVRGLEPLTKHEDRFPLMVRAGSFLRRASVPVGHRLERAGRPGAGAARTRVVTPAEVTAAKCAFSCLVMSGQTDPASLPDIVMTATSSALRPAVKDLDLPYSRCCACRRSRQGVRAA
jgi:hypothetical protein